MTEPGGSGGEVPPVEELRRRVEAGLVETRRRIVAAGGDPARVVVVAVTKGLGVDAVRAALAAGLDQVGENYAGELLDKATAMASTGAGAAQPVWHYIGNIQRRKVRSLAPVVGVWQSVARLVEGEEIARRAPGSTVLVEVEATGLPGRQGVRFEDAAALVEGLSRLDLSVRGLMTVAAPGGGDEARRVFRVVAGLADDLGLRERSMGMSGDLEEAVEAGSTTVRVGTALFGPRPGAPRPDTIECPGGGLMAQKFMHKAMVYLGLVDMDEEDDYEDDVDEPGTGRGRQPAYADTPVPAAEFSPTATVRPLPRDEARDVPSTLASRTPVLRPLTPVKQPKVNVVAPAQFADAQEIGDFVKSGTPVIVNLQSSERDLARRMIDFCSGVTYALAGSMEKVADQVFLLTPSNVEVSPEERQRLQDRGLIRR